MKAGRTNYQLVEKFNGLQLRIISLYISNHDSQFYVREMAKLIGKSHVGLLPHLKELVNKRILKMKKIGNNKVYSLNFSNSLTKEYLIISEKFKLIIFLNKEFFIKKIYEEFSGLNGSLILFGSYASVNYSKKSDIDLLFIGKIKDNEKKDLINTCKSYNKKVHLVCITSNQFVNFLKKKEPLINEVIKNHIVLSGCEFFINNLWRNKNG